MDPSESKKAFDPVIAGEKLHEVIRAVDTVLIGKEDRIREVLISLLANGHVLISDVPGTGKTTLAKAFGRVLSLTSGRIQFTPDVLPSDLTGFSVYRPDQGRFVYEKGSVFKNLILADEINRGAPKTQSALLEVMEERQVTVEGVTREVPSPFLVIATANPAGAVGTDLLPEAEIDRFLISLSIGFPNEKDEIRMAERASGMDPIKSLAPVLAEGEFKALQDLAERVEISDHLCTYLTRLIRATRENIDLSRGASPRATAGFVRLAKASALLDGRDFVTPSDIMSLFLPLARHRVALSKDAREGQRTVDMVLKEILSKVPAPKGKDARY